MRYKWIFNLLFLLIAQQSALAVAEVHQIETFTENKSHLVFQINVLKATSALSAKSTADQHFNDTVTDCHLDCSNYDCCTYFTFSTIILNTSPNKIEKVSVDYELSIIESPHPPFLRPPKS